MVLHAATEVSDAPAEPAALLRSAHAMYAVDLDQRITFMNDCAGDQLRPGANLLGRRCYEVLANVDPRNALLCRPNCPVITQARVGRAANDFEVWTQAPDGRSGRVRVTILLQEQEGETDRTRVVHMVRPVEDREEHVAAARGRHTRTFRPRTGTSAEAAARAGLTPRQVSALRLLADGCSPDEIAANLGVRPITVRNHIQAAMDRLGARSRLEAVIIASRTGLLSEAS